MTVWRILISPIGATSGRREYDEYPNNEEKSACLGGIDDDFRNGGLSWW